MKTNPFKNLLKTAFLAVAVLLSFVGFGQNLLDQSSYASSLASVSKTSAYRWEGNPTFEEENPEVSLKLSPLTCITLSVTVTNLTCSGDHSGAINLNVTGGVAPYYYDWRTDVTINFGEATHQNLSGLSPGNYTVTVTSADGCTATTTVAVTATYISPSVTVSGAEVCSSQTATLTASGATSYSWNTGATVPTITAVATNNPYFVIGTDANGCATEENVNIYVKSQFTVASASSLTICATQSTTLTASEANTYTWSTGATTASIVVSPSSTTVYSVTGTGDCITNVATVTITVNSSAAPTVAISGSSTICPESSATYTASGSPSDYSWNTGTGGSTSSVLNGSNVPAGGSFTVIVTATDASTGCTNSASLTVNNPGPSFTLPLSTSSQPQVICSQNSYTIHATVSPGSSYTWTPSLSGLNPVVSPSVSTIYSLSVSNASCVVNGTFHLFVLPTPTITLASPVNVCSGNSYTINPSVVGTYTNVEYNWSPITNLSSSTTATTVASVSSNSTFTFTASNILNYHVSETPQVLVCYDSKSITLNVAPNPTISISGGSSNICPGQTTTLTATGATSYTWNPTAPTTVASSITVGVSGAAGVNGTVPYNGSQTFSITGSDANGCIATATYTVSDPVPTVSLNLAVNSDYPTTICSGSSYSLNAQVSSGVTSYTWNPNLSGLNPVITPTATSVYSITVSNGTCTASTHGTIRILPTPTVSLTSPIYICSGNSYTLVPSTSGTIENTAYNWNPSLGLSSSNTATTVANPTSTTDYTLTATNYQYMGGHINIDGVFVQNDTVFCKDTASVNIIITSNPAVPTITYSTVCGSNFTTLSIPSPNNTYTYTWSGPCYNGTGNSVNVNSVGVYTVSVTNSCGVVTTNTINVLLIGNIVAGFQTHINFIEESGSNYIHFENLSLGDNLIYNWNFGNGDNSIITNPNETFDTVGVFQVHLYDSDNMNCKDTASATVVLSGHHTILIIPNSFTPNNDNVDDVFEINGIGVTNFTCQISDKWGNLLYQWNNLNGSWNGLALNGHVFATGNYFYLLSYTDYNGINQSRSGIITLK